ncbi:MAG: HAD hydrolase-like protein, partial [Clostridiales bacterium]|nr:HAD hydrolase-like protein [Clostridiales bacterium]
MIELARPFSFIFDMDGTLINTALATVAACQRCAPRFKLPVRQPSDITTLIGCHDAEFYRRLYPGYGADLLEEYALEVENDENDAMACMGGEILFEGAYELLSILCERRSYVSLASTGSESHVCAALSAGGISEFFKDVRCGSPDKTAMVKGIVENAPSGTWMIIGDRLADCT